MAMDTQDANAAFLPEQIGQLVVQPVMAGSVAAQVGTVVNISGHEYRVPLVTADPSAAWVAEAGTITASDATFDEVTVTPSKVAGLTVISRELAEDGSPAAQQVVGDGLARDIARKIDGAFFDADGTVTNGPSGIESQASDLATATYASGGVADLDWAYSAISESAKKGGVLTSFVTDPATALAVRTLKTDSTDSNESLPWPSDLPPLLSSSDVTAGTIYGIDSRFVQVVVRDNTRLEVDRSVYFESDQVAVKATMRIGFAFTHPAALVKVTEASA